MVDKYIDYISGIRRYSERTCDIYRRILEDFFRFSEISYPSEISANSIRNYEVELLDNRKNSSNSVNLALSVISGFCRFLVKEGVLKANPIRIVKRPKLEKRLPEFYRQESMEEYFKNTEYITKEENSGIVNYDKRLGRLIVSILFNTGIRRSELISLSIGSVDFKRRILKVTGKGDKMREIPVISSLLEEISLYLQEVESIEGRGRTLEEPLLVTKKGVQLYPVFIDRTIKNELGSIGSITGRKSPHVLRHTLATELLNEGTDLNSIKEMLGHSSLAATQVYTHNSVEKLKKVYNNAHPRAKSGGNYGNQD